MSPSRPVREHRWILLAFGGVVLIMVAISAFMMTHVERQLLAQSGETLSLAATDIADKLDLNLFERAADIQRAALLSAPLLSKREFGRVAEYLFLLQQTQPIYLWLGVTDHSGRIVSSTDVKSTGRDFGQSAWFRDALQDRTPHVYDPGVSDLAGAGTTIAFTAPILGEDGEFLGVLKGETGLAAYEDLFSRTVGIFQSKQRLTGQVEWQFLDKSGKALSESRLYGGTSENLLGHGVASARLALDPAHLPGYIEETHVRRNVPVVTGHAHTEGYGRFKSPMLGVLVREDRADILAPIHTLMWALGLAGAAAVLPMVSFLLWTTRRVQRLLVELETRVRQRTEELAKRNALLVAQQDSMLDGIVAMDRDGRILSYNKCWLEQWGLPALPLGSATDERALPVMLDKLAKPQEFLALVRDPNTHQDGPTRHEIALHDGRVMEWSRAPVIGHDGHHDGWVWDFRDMTRQKELEQSRLAQFSAERASQAKSEFLSRMSHELRTPLNAILGFGQLLEMEPLTPDQQESVGRILRAGRHLLNLINEVLDISRIETGRLGLSLEPVPLQSTVREAMELIRPQATTRGITVQLDGTMDGPLHVMADHQRLRQALLNLLSNAVKYNRDAGRITVGCAQPADGLARISVTDTGPGISQEKLARLFEPFDRLDADEKGIEGVGLGLCLTARLVEAMNGRLIVDSTVGRGSTFSIELAIASAPSAEAVPSQPAGAAGSSGPTRTILYIEDNPSNLELIKMLLGSRPEISLLWAMQGRLGLELARQHKPDLILLDLHLPDLDGEAVLLQVKSEPALRDIPVIILSADASPKQIQRLRESGAHDYLTKPLDLKQVLKLLHETLDINGS